MLSGLVIHAVNRVHYIASISLYFTDIVYIWRCWLARHGCCVTMCRYDSELCCAVIVLVSRCRVTAVVYWRSTVVSLHARPHFTLLLSSATSTTILLVFTATSSPSLFPRTFRSASHSYRYRHYPCPACLSHHIVSIETTRCSVRITFASWS